MGPHLMDVVVEGRRDRTSAAALLASGPAWDERLGEEPRCLLDVHIGGLDLPAIVGGHGWERLGWQAFPASGTGSSRSARTRPCGCTVSYLRRS